MKTIKDQMLDSYLNNKTLRLLSFFLYPKNFSISKISATFRKPQFEMIQRKSDAYFIQAAEWLYNAFIKGYPGNSAHYNFFYGWVNPYPETTGYIIETFYDIANQTYVNDFFDAHKYSKAAITMADWLLEIQLPDGSFPGGVYKRNSNYEGNVFNTGQIILGLNRSYRETYDDKYLVSSKRAADWLVEVQNSDGTWTKKTYENDAKSYHSRVSWPLLDVYQLTNINNYKLSAIKNLDWVITNQKENFWFFNANFSEKNTCLTHTLAYTLRGLLESGQILNDNKYVNVSKSTAEKLMKIYEIQKYKLLPGLFDMEWKQKSDYSCLTGCAQISIIWSKLFLLTEDIRFFNAALKINDALKATQLIKSNNKGICGGIKGSEPIYGAYMPYSYPNWATKFYIDALLLEKQIISNYI